MSEADSFGAGRVPSGRGAGPEDVRDLIARAQRLGDSPRPADGYSVRWYVEASLVGDITALTVAALRSEALLQR